MIIIFSSTLDSTTNQVIEILNRNGHPVTRINEHAEISSFNCEIGGGSTINIGKLEISLDQISSVWFRKPYLNFQEHQFFSKKNKPHIFSKNAIHELKRFVQEEQEVVREYIFHILLQCKTVLGNPFTATPNKLVVLEKAKQCGLIVPCSYVLNNRSAALRLLSHKENYITKPLSEVLSLDLLDKKFISYTKPISKEYFEETDSTKYYPFLVQEEIKKQFEIRLFFLHNKLYPISIHTFGEDNDCVDMRASDYGQSLTQRFSKLILGTNHEINIQSLINELKLDIGVMDLIYSATSELIFLEVNPVGQFGRVSQMGRYNIEEIIANYLML